MRLNGENFYRITHKAAANVFGALWAFYKICTANWRTLVAEWLRQCSWLERPIIKSLISHTWVAGVNHTFESHLKLVLLMLLCGSEVYTDLIKAKT